MEPRDWSQAARAIRVEKKRIGEEIKHNAETTDLRSAFLVMEALENVAMKMAGGYVDD